VLNTETIFRFGRTCVVGGTVAVVDFGTAWSLSHFLQPLVAVSISYFVAVTCHFLLNKFWVFRCRRSDYVRQLIQYLIAVLASWLTTVSTVQLCLSTITNNLLIAKLFAFPPATLVGFTLMQLLVFRRPSNSVAVRYEKVM
jgi:putative flippase GtrA